MKLNKNYTFKKEDKRGDYNSEVLRIGELTNRGYIRHEYLCDDGKLHRILEHVAKWMYFNGEIPEGMEIDHINGNRADNRLSNLRLVTHKDNCNNEVTLKRYKARRHSNEEKEKLSVVMTNHLATSRGVIQIDSNGTITKYPSLNECGRKGYSQRHVCNACQGKNYSKGHKYKGSLWYYEDEYVSN